MEQVYNTEIKSALLKYSVPNLGNINEVRYSHYSIYKVSDSVYIEGYWFEGSYKDTRFPLPKPAESKVGHEFINTLKNIIDENTHENFDVTKIDYLGHSSCRLCKKSNGRSEFTIKNLNGIEFRVPDGYMHYLEKHNIHPSEEFKDFILADNE